MRELSINCSCPAGREGGTNTVRFNRNAILQICLMYWGEREVTKVIERADWATRERQTLKSRACNLLRRYTVRWRREELDVVTSYGNKFFSYLEIQDLHTSSRLSAFPPGPAVHSTAWCNNNSRVVVTEAISYGRVVKYPLAS